MAFQGRVLIAYTWRLGGAVVWNAPPPGLVLPGVGGRIVQSFTISSALERKVGSFMNIFVDNCTKKVIAEKLRMGIQMPHDLRIYLYQCATTNIVLVIKHVIMTTIPYIASARLSRRRIFLLQGPAFSLPPPSSPSSSLSDSSSSSSSFISFWCCGDSGAEIL